MTVQAIEVNPWQALLEAHEGMRGGSILSLFDSDPHRAADFALEVDGILLDYSKHAIDRRALGALLALAKAKKLEPYRDAMFDGAAINSTEGRAVLHTVLRTPEGPPLLVNGEDVRASVRRELQQMGVFAHAVRAGELRCNDGGRFTTVVNIGIGGSDLGPKMAIQALAPFADAGLTFHFMSNPDSNEVLGILETIDPARTLFLVSSKTFTTQDTLANFRTAVDYMAAEHGSHAAAMAHFCAITAAPEVAHKQGFAETRTFQFGEWVGGRYSLWSAIGLSIVLAIGPQRFNDFLAGARAMDEHFRTAPLAANMPVLLALTGVWNGNVLGARTLLMAPYDTRLGAFPAYVQQLDMESNGKRVDLSGQALERSSGPVVWGGLGINGQHAYFQLVHQGTQLVPVDFIGVLRSPAQNSEHQRIVFSNMLAQAEALMCGRSAQQVRAEMLANGVNAERADQLSGHRAFPGNIPSNTLLLDELSPRRLGSLIALYEHKVFVQGVLWGINSFDQWGVELGKQLGKSIYNELCEGPDAQAHDASTRNLLARVFEALK